MTVFPEKQVKSYLIELQAKHGIVLKPSRFTTKYYSLVSWDKDKFATAKDVKLFLSSEYDINILSFKEDDNFPTLVNYQLLT